MADRLSRELTIAVQAVELASLVCQKVQRSLVTADTLEKKDRSPVTVADFASQAVVCHTLGEAFPDDLVVGEEDARQLRDDDQTPLAASVRQQVAGVLGDLDQTSVLGLIDRGAAMPSASTKRFWTLDPIDGTKGFLRGEQYAVALALIEDGKVVLGALACPNLILAGRPGTLMTAVRGQGAFMQPLDQGAPPERVHANTITDAAQARFCESVESGHSDQSRSAQIAQMLGMTGKPYRIDSQAKYAAVARGDASIYMRLPTRADYREKIWDHAAGSIVVEEAGGTVTDIAGKPLDFSKGRSLDANRGILATAGTIHQQVIEAIEKTQ